MRAHRHILVTTLITLCAFGSVLYTSCKSKCGSTTCQNGGICKDNKCVCVLGSGYSGSSCQNGWSDPVIGTYKCTRSNCYPAVTGVNAWTSAITKSSVNSGFTINISNFDNSNSIVTGTIDSAIGGVNKILISPPAGTYGINASGTYSNGVMTLHFTTASSVGPGYTCDMTLTKQ